MPKEEIHAAEREVEQVWMVDAQGPRAVFIDFSLFCIFASNSFASKRIVARSLQWDIGLQVDDLILAYVIVHFLIKPFHNIIFWLRIGFHLDLQHRDLNIVVKVPSHNKHHFLLVVDCDYLKNVRSNGSPDL